MPSRIFLLVVLLLIPRLVLAQSEPAPAAVSEELGARDSLLTRLPPQLRDEGRQVLATRDEDQRADLAEDLADLGVEETTDFLLGVLATDPSAEVRITIIEEIGDEQDARIVSALRQHLTSDPDPEVSLTALRMLNERYLADLGSLLEKRLDQARRNGDQEEIHLIALAQRQNLVRQAGANLPEFMQAPPPVFAVEPADQSIRVLAFGDFGTGQAQQKEVAAAMLKYHEQHPFDLGLTLGDNFYSKGMQSPDDPRWKSWWHDMYDPLGIPFYAALGNHDWGFADSPASEILYSGRSTNWHMPATYYTYTAGPVQFFALETDVLSDAELMWLDRELAKSKARWKVA
ncbi:MAG TPA: HEAT repeat domain-containing protein, partial [Rhodothermales bacterium]|nr:HEAT repeat domain-containing protein [Rhodothermales bacterium]